LSLSRAGSDICSALAAEVGAAVAAASCLRLHGDQRTDAPELYAAGDVILGLDRISHAMGAGGVAVTTIGIDLAQQTPLRR
jgi:thioredoxin reductase (NADPH)